MALSLSHPHTRCRGMHSMPAEACLPACPQEPDHKKDALNGEQEHGGQEQRAGALCAYPNNPVIRGVFTQGVWCRCRGLSCRGGSAENRRSSEDAAASDGKARHTTPAAAHYQQQATVHNTAWLVVTGQNHPGPSTPKGHT